LNEGDILKNKSNEPLLEMFKFETLQLLEQLEQIIIDCEKSNCFDKEDVNEIFRIMHTIKGSSAMMNFNNISSIAHSLEDLFCIIRERNLSHFCNSNLCDYIFESIDYIKTEIQSIEKGKIQTERPCP
jgi:two-component system chemotaxis sensor kinase CheA